MGSLDKVISAVLIKNGINGSQFSLEITESMMANNNQLMIEILNNIKLLGVEIFMDDFGMCYSSLSYLSTLPIDYITIDKSFIDYISCEEDKYVILDAILAMGKALNMGVVAEGV